MTRKPVIRFACKYDQLLTLRLFYVNMTNCTHIVSLSSLPKCLQTVIIMKKLKEQKRIRTRSRWQHRIIQVKKQNKWLLT